MSNCSKMHNDETAYLKYSEEKGYADTGLQPTAQPAADKQQLTGKGDRVPCDHSCKSD